MLDHTDSPPSPVQPAVVKRERSWSGTAILIGVVIPFAAGLGRGATLAAGVLWIMVVGQRFDALGMLLNVSADLPPWVSGILPWMFLLVSGTFDFLVGVFAGWQVARQAPSKWLVDSLLAGLIVTLFTSDRLRVWPLLLVGILLGAALYARRHQTVPA